MKRKGWLVVCPFWLGTILPGPGECQTVEIECRHLRVIDAAVLGLELRSPASFAYDVSRDEFLVADTLNQRIVICKVDGERVAELDLSGERISPLGIAVGRGGKMYVTHQESGEVSILDFRGRVEHRIHPTQPEGKERAMLGKVRTDDFGTIWSIDRVTGKAVSISPTELEVNWFEPEFPRGERRKPIDLIPTTDGGLWLLSALGTAVYRFDAGGHLLVGMGQHGPGEDQLSLPAGFGLGFDKTVWVADKFRHRISVFAPTGEHLGNLGGPGTGDHEFRFPTDCLFLSQDELAVLDSGNGRIQICTVEWPDGKRP